MDYELLMKRCIELAQNGSGTVSPNPMVGALIVKNERIIGEGWHRKAGEPHAEVMAVQSVAEPGLVEGATIVVNLEPCSHFGRTPPCTDLIITKKFKKVIIGSLDPNPQVAGTGVKKLRDAGIEVEVGVKEAECNFLNRRFFTFHTQKRPYIILKWVQSADNFMDILRKGNKKGIHWISGPRTKILVHQWRSQEDAIIVGSNTILNDNPELTVREINGKSPLRLIPDSENKIPVSAKVFQDNNYVRYVHYGQEQSTSENTVPINFKENNLQQIFEDCYQRNIQSIFVEGGTRLLQSFLDQNLWDEARVITSETFIGKGLPAPKLNCQPSQRATFDNDVINIFLNDLVTA